jgi:hypothetical protein
MKKILVSLLVLALCAPAMAATITLDDIGSGQATITVATEGGEANIVGLGLDVTVTGGSVTAVSVDTADFNIYPDAAYTQELGDGYTYGEGTPVAAKLVAGEIALPQSEFALSLGNLNGETTPGADGAASVVITVTWSGDELEVCENATRGGIVAVDGTSLDAACDTLAGGTPPCVKDTAPFYADWVAFGEPECWCYQKNCRGDYDGLLSGPFRVGIPDLQGFLAAYNQIVLPAGGICADFDHVPSGPFRVGIPDLQTLLQYYNQLDSIVPVCDSTNYNFWTN